MPPKAPGASDGKSSELEEEIMGAMLLACGELGFRNVAVEAVLERYGGSRAQFYRHFANLGECYEAAYEAEAERLCLDILRAGAEEPNWRRGLRAALDVLASFTRQRPMAARALLIDVHIAGEPATSKRKEIFERLSHAIDSGRRETESRHSPPPFTALFMVSAIEASVVSALTSGEPARFEEAVPELTQIAATAYFGDEPPD